MFAVFPCWFFKGKRFHYWNFRASGSFRRLKFWCARRPEPHMNDTAGQPPERPVKTDKGSPKPTRLVAPNPRNPHAKRAPGPPRPCVTHRVGAPNTTEKRKKGSPNLSAQNPKEKLRENPEKSYGPRTKTRTSPRQHNPSKSEEPHGKRTRRRK